MGRRAMHTAWLLVGAVVVGCGSGASPGAPEATGTTSEALQQCVTNTVEGVDVYDGTGTIDWNAVKGAGVDFALIKATQGTYNTQTNFATNWSGSKAAGLYRSAYHFFDPTEDGVAQAQSYLAAVGTLAPDDLPPMLDIECPDGDANCLYTGGSGQAAASDIQTRMWNWIHTVEQATGKKPIIYTFGSYFSSNGIDTTGLQAYPLYIADIVTGSCFSVPSPWSSAVIWQYSWTGTVAGISGQVDRDKFIGTLADLQAFAQGSNGTVSGGDGGVGPVGDDGGAGPVGGDGGAGPAGGDGGAGPAGDDGGAGSAGGDGGSWDNASGGASAPGSSGCGCRVTQDGNGTWAGLLPAVLLGGVLAARRKRRGARADAQTRA